LPAEYARTRITGPFPGPPNTLTRPVEVVLRTNAECRENPDLESFRVPAGPSAEECRIIISNLLEEAASPQIVAFISERETGNLLALASVRLQGNLEVQLNLDNPPWLRELSRHPYVGLLVRDERYRGCVLGDGRTRLSTVALRAVVEAATPPDGPPPFMWAFCQRENAPSLRAFARNGFHPHTRDDGVNQYVLTRLAATRLLAPPERSVYIPPRTPVGPQLAA
jgi:hypothetical protein